MGAFLFVYIPRQTKNVVRPSYDGQSLMSKDSVAKRRSDCQGVAPTEMNYPSNTLCCVVDATPFHYVGLHCVPPESVRSNSFFAL